MFTFEEFITKRNIFYVRYNEVLFYILVCVVHENGFEAEIRNPVNSELLATYQRNEKIYTDSILSEICADYLYS